MFSPGPSCGPRGSPSGRPLTTTVLNVDAALVGNAPVAKSAIVKQSRVMLIYEFPSCGEVECTWITNIKASAAPLAAANHKRGALRPAAERRQRKRGQGQKRERSRFGYLHQEQATPRGELQVDEQLVPSIKHAAMCVRAC